MSELLDSLAAGLAQVSLVEHHRVLKAGDDLLAARPSLLLRHRLRVGSRLKRKKPSGNA